MAKFAVFFVLLALFGALSANHLPNNFTFVVQSGNSVTVYNTGSTVGVATVAIGGLPTGVNVLAITLRNSNNVPYALGSNGVLYTVAAGATALTATPFFTLNATTCPLSTSVLYSIDVNPAADALRIVGNDGSNKRAPFSGNGNCFVDGPITYTTDSDDTLEPVGVAYTVNVSTSTSEFVLDADEDALAQVTVPNAGNSTEIADTPVDLNDNVASPMDFVRVNNVDYGFALIGTTLYTFLTNGSFEVVNTGYTAGTGLIVVPNGVTFPLPAAATTGGLSTTGNATSVATTSTSSTGGADGTSDGAGTTSTSSASTTMFSVFFAVAMILAMML